MEKPPQDRTTQTVQPNEPATPRLIEPFGGRLVDLLVSDEERESLANLAAQLPRIQLTQRNLCDLELLATGAFSPLTKFMSKDDYIRVVHDMRLADGTLFPIPITLPVASSYKIFAGADIALADEHNDLFAVMRVDDVYEWDRDEHARSEERRVGKECRSRWSP